MSEGIVDFALELELLRQYGVQITHWRHPPLAPIPDLNPGLRFGFNRGERIFGLGVSSRGSNTEGVTDCVKRKQCCRYACILLELFIALAERRMCLFPRCRYWGGVESVMALLENID